MILFYRAQSGVKTMTTKIKYYQKQRLQLYKVIEGMGQCPQLFEKFPLKPTKFKLKLIVIQLLIINLG